MRTPKPPLQFLLLVLTAVTVTTVFGEPLNKNHKPMMTDGLGAEIKNLLEPNRAKQQAAKSDREHLKDTWKEILNDQNFADKHHLEGRELEAYRFYQSYRQLRERRVKLEKAVADEEAERTDPGINRKDIGGASNIYYQWLGLKNQTEAKRQIAEIDKLSPRVEKAWEDAGYLPHYGSLKSVERHPIVNPYTWERTDSVEVNILKYKRLDQEKQKFQYWVASGPPEINELIEALPPTGNRDHLSRLLRGKDYRLLADLLRELESDGKFQTRKNADGSYQMELNAEAIAAAHAKHARAAGVASTTPTPPPTPSTPAPPAVTPPPTKAPGKTPPPPPSGPVNDAGLPVNPSVYQIGDMVIARDGVEYELKSVGWVTTGNLYAPTKTPDTCPRCNIVTKHGNTPLCTRCVAIVNGDYSMQRAFEKDGPTKRKPREEAFWKYLPKGALKK